jgi:head-tail adaptor
MARQVGGSAWPRTGERRHKATLQRATSTTDSMGGRTQTWTAYDSWSVKVTTVPFAVSDSQATSQYLLEGLYRDDVLVGDRVLVKGLKLKVILLDNSELRNKTLVAHCSKWAATNV